MFNLSLPVVVVVVGVVATVVVVVAAALIGYKEAGEKTRETMVC